MKKIFLLFLGLIILHSSMFGFDMDKNIFTQSNSAIVKKGNIVTLDIGNYYQTRDITEYKIDANKWYSVKYCGVEIYPIFGSNYFVIYGDHEPERNYSFLNADNYDEYVKNNFYHGNVHHGDKVPKNNDDYFWQITRHIKSIDVPDVLQEKINGKTVVYDTYDMMHFFYTDIETYAKYYRFGAKPWATSKNPIGLKIRMNLTEERDKIVILNGYVHPGKRYLYKANRRIKSVKITSPESSFTVRETIEDVVHFHEIKLPSPVKTVDIEITDFYEGEKYKDLCVQMFGLRNLTEENQYFHEDEPTTAFFNRPIFKEYFD